MCVCACARDMCVCVYFLCEGIWLYRVRKLITIIIQLTLPSSTISLTSFGPSVTGSFTSSICK